MGIFKWHIRHCSNASVKLCPTTPWPWRFGRRMIWEYAWQSWIADSVYHDIVWYIYIWYNMIYIYLVGLLGFVFHPSFEVIDHVHVDPFWCPWSLLKKMPGWVSRDFARRCRGLLCFGTYPLRDATTTAIHHVHRMRWRGIWHCHWCPRSRLWLDCWRPQRNRGSLFLHKKNHSEPTDVNVMNVW